MRRGQAAADHLAGYGIPGEISEIGVEFSPALRYAAWARAGLLLGRLGRSHQFWIGDWLVFGEARYGERFAQAAEATGYDAGTLLNLAHVARAVERSRRRPELSWGHHHAVAALDPAEQARLLDAAVAGEPLPAGGRRPWSVARLREAVRIARRKGLSEPEGAPRTDDLAATEDSPRASGSALATEPLLPEIAVGARFRIGSVVYAVTIVDGPWTDGAVSLRLERLTGGL